MRTFIENYLHFMKNCIRPHYEKLKSLKSGFIENSIFENNRDPWICSTWLAWQWGDYHMTKKEIFLRLNSQRLRSKTHFIIWVVTNWGGVGSSLIVGLHVPLFMFNWLCTGYIFAVIGPTKMSIDTSAFIGQVTVTTPSALSNHHHQPGSHHSSRKDTS